ncbi:short-chain fatty acyl-CoA regulator family protein [uncultured Sulfitobacter sp.]|uniref:short-chain fatty acyl-CoA regulator family protein n=1 Tax=uncultured Sulfitobacter sp. TaxID=191468 RepID=UPI00261C1285|nr:short-chain fatty acyl-CoA regulator family protein [uncultured Sulfitobacter sp.]
MAVETLTGSRIRERRVIAGLKQAELARDIGISASYLNLIEHNRRRIGGKLLLSIAQRLGTEAQTLTEGAEAALIATLREAAVEAGLTGPEAAQAEDFAGRFPGWADVLAGTRRRVAALEETIEALSDRLAHDPHLAASMHELLTTAASIRSTAAILAETKTLQPEWRSRFHANINEDSRRLSESAEALLGHLNVEADAADAAGSPQEEVEAFLTRHAYRFDVLERAGDTTDALKQVIEEAADLRSQASRFIAARVLEMISQDAQALPMQDVQGAIETHGTDPMTVARRLGQPVGRVLRRMAALPDLGAGLVVCDRAGTVIFRKSVEGFTVPRHGACCPLWPLFAALAQPGTVLSEKVNQVGRAEAGFVSYATAEAATPSGYNSVPLVQGVMLLLPAAPDGAASRKVGSTCRVCPQEGCVARREPSIMSTGI